MQQFPADILKEDVQDMMEYLIYMETTSFIEWVSEQEKSHETEHMASHKWLELREQFLASTQLTQESEILLDKLAYHTTGHVFAAAVRTFYKLEGRLP